MSAPLALSRQLRPATFAEIRGQEPIVRTLRRAIDANTCPQALLFVGPRGTGKTSAARIVAAALNCAGRIEREPCTRCSSCLAIREGAAFDVRESNAAVANRVDDVRDELLPFLASPPLELPYKVLILDEVQRFSSDAWDALLKPLEEPAPRTIVIFATTDPSRIPPAVLSRLTRFDFRPLERELIVEKLETALATVGRRATPDAVALIARLADGGMRDAETILEQLLGGGVDPIDAAAVEELLGLPAATEIETLATAILTGDATAGYALLEGFERRGRSAEQVAGALVDLVRRGLHAALATGVVPADPAALPPGCSLPGSSGPVALAGRSRGELATLADALAPLLALRDEGGRRLALELLLTPRSA